MSTMINTLEQLRQLRQNSLNQTISQLARQQQLCQRYQNNIDALTTLAHPLVAPITPIHISQMANYSHYKSHIQRVIDWQKQEQMLADIETDKLQTQLQQQACREKIVAVVLEQQQLLSRQEQERREQKETDAQAMQCWQRRHTMR